MAATISRLVALASVVALLLAGMALPAVAESVTVRDAKGDVRHFDNSTDKQTRYRGTRDDITSLRITHTGAYAYFRVDFTKIHRGKHRHELLFTIRADNSGSQSPFYATLTVTPSTTSQGVVDLSHSSRGRTKCPPVTRKIDWTNGFAWVRIPRACLGNPQRIRASVDYSRRIPKPPYFEEVVYDGAPYAGNSNLDHYYSRWVRRG